MSPERPRQWMDEQRGLGRCVCVVLDAHNELEARTALLNGRAPDRYYSVYSQTPVTELAPAGPFLIELDGTDTERLSELLNAPERNWGWLASLTPGDLPLWLEHWRARILVSARPERALYRFQDNRVLSRALRHLSAEQLPTYLGQAISVCYWQGEQWATTDNPAPGEYALPEAVAWLSVPAPSRQQALIHAHNARCFLLEKHFPAYHRLAGQLNPFEWLSGKQTQALQWGWVEEAQLVFLLLHSLQHPGFELPKAWHPHPHETAALHFERVSQAAEQAGNGVQL